MKIFKLQCIAAFAIVIIFPIKINAQADQALARAQYMMRQLNAEKTALAKENVDLKKELEQLKKDYSRLKNKSKKTSNALVDRLKEEKEKLLNSSNSIVEMEETIKKKNHLIKNMEQHMKLYDKDLYQCIDHNKTIYQYSMEMLNEGLWKPAKKTEPFIQFRRVKIENLAQDYQYKIQDERFDSNITLPEYIDKKEKISLENSHSDNVELKE